MISLSNIINSMEFWLSKQPRPNAQVYVYRNSRYCAANLVEEVKLQTPLGKRIITEVQKVYVARKYKEKAN